MDLIKHCIQQLIAPPVGLHDQLMTLILYRQRLVPGNRSFTPSDLRKMYEEVDLEPPSEDKIRSYLGAAQHCYRTAKEDHYTVKERLPDIWQKGLANCLNRDVRKSTTPPKSVRAEQGTPRGGGLKSWPKDHWFASWIMFIVAILGIILSIFFWFLDRDPSQTEPIPVASQSTPSAPDVLEKRCIQQLIAPPIGLHDQLMTLILYRQKLVPGNRSFTPSDLRKMYEEVDLEPPSGDKIRSYLRTAQHCYRTAKED